MHIRCPHCQNAIEYIAHTHEQSITCPSCNSQITFEEDDDSPKTVVLGDGKFVAHFQLLETIGVGGFGTVHSARDTKLDRLVAIKLPRAGGMTETSLKKVLKEARAAAQVRHPNIVSVHEVGREIDTDQVYIVSDLIQGVSLQQWLRTRQPSPRQTAELIYTVLRAIEAAHAAGIVHRDLKPGNILMDGDDVPYVTDFGLAKREAAEITMTAKGVVLGTPAGSELCWLSSTQHSHSGRNEAWHQWHM